MPDACKPRACLARVGRIPTSATKGETKVLAAHRFGYPIDPEIYLSGHSQRPIFAMTARHGDAMTARHGDPCCCRKQDNVASKEMCHEDIHRRSRVDLADRDPVAHRDCKRSPRVPVEFLVREQRLLTISGASERFCPRLKICIRLAAGLHPRVGRPLAARSILAIKRFCSPRRLLSGLINGAVGRTNERKRDQSKARQIKSR
jgi:hypothetical protein